MTIDIYNLSISYLNDHKDIKIGKYDLRNKIKNLCIDQIKQFDVPNTSVEYAIFDALTAFKQGKNTQKRSYKNQTSFSIGIDGRNIRNGIIYSQNTNRQFKQSYSQKIFSHLKDSLKMKKLENFEYEIDGICRLVWKKHYNEFYLAIPVPTNKHEELPKREIVALDPGVRSFMTFYDGESYGEIGKDMYLKLKRFHKKIKLIDGKLFGEKRFFKRSKYKKARARILRKLLT